MSMYGRVLQQGYQQGFAAAEAEWSEATGFDSVEEARQASASRRKPLEVEFPGRWIMHRGRRRFVRGYRNGRFGYWDGGVFVDVDLTGGGPAAA